MPEKRKFLGWLKWFIAVLAIGVLVFLIWLLFRPKETYTSEPITTSRLDALTCIGEDIEDAFFGFEYAISNRHEIKVTFDSNKLNSMSYNYNGVFESNEVARTADASMHGKYNKYMSGLSLSQRSLDPVFAVMDNNTKISLYASSDKITHQTAALFFIDGDEFQRLSSRSLDETEELYEGKGFTCQDTE